MANAVLTGDAFNTHVGSLAFDTVQLTTPTARRIISAETTPITIDDSTISDATITEEMIKTAGSTLDMTTVTISDTVSGRNIIYATDTQVTLNPVNVNDANLDEEVFVTSGNTFTMTNGGIDSPTALGILRSSGTTASFTTVPIPTANLAGTAF